MFGGHGWKPVTLRDDPKPLAPELDPGVIDVTPATIGDRQDVAAIRKFLDDRRLESILRGA